MPTKIQKFFLDLLFPKFCFNCKREGSYLCSDCLSMLEIFSTHQKYSTKSLTDLYFALPYQNILVKKLIQKFKYKPFIKELAETLALLIITHFQLLDNKPNFVNFTPHHFPDNQVIHRNKFNQAEYPKSGGGFILIPIPLNEKRRRWRGFNQAEEIGKELSKFFKVPLVSDCLLRIKNSYPQVKLGTEERKENVKDIFFCQNKKETQHQSRARCWTSPVPKRSFWCGVFGKKILLVDDVYTTGATMEEAARILKESGAKEVFGVVVARAQPGEDKFENV